MKQTKQPTVAVGLDGPPEKYRGKHRLTFASDYCYNAARGGDIAHTFKTRDFQKGDLVTFVRRNRVDLHRVRECKDGCLVLAGTNVIYPLKATSYSVERVYLIERQNECDGPD